MIRDLLLMLCAVLAMCAGGYLMLQDQEAAYDAELHAMLRR